MRKKSNIRSEYKSIRKPSNRLKYKNTNSRKRDDDDGFESKIDNDPKTPNTSGNYINENI